MIQLRRCCRIRVYISFITELELIGFKDITEDEEKQIASLLNECAVIYLNNNIKAKYIETRKKYHLKLADAVLQQQLLHLIYL
jgi:hypothetical protein